MNRRSIKSRILFILATALACAPAGVHTLAQQGVLEPEDANEARLNRLQPPDQVMDAIGVKPGMVVAEIGAGRGRYVVQLAVRVGEQGKIYAEDIDRAALRHCADRSRRWGLENVETIVGEVTDPKLPEGELDMIFVISAYHHFSDPVTLMRNARPALKPGGYVAIVEWLPRDGRMTGEGSPEEVEAEMKTAGFRLERTDPFLKENRLMIYIFHPTPLSNGELTDTHQSEDLPLHTERVSERVLRVWPGDHAQTTNMIALASEQGVVVVDTEHSWSVTAAIREVIEREFDRSDIRYLINTHAHSDHIGGNQVFDDVVIIAHERCADNLRNSLSPEYIQGVLASRRRWLASLEEQYAALPAGHPDAAAAGEQIRYLRRVIRDLQEDYRPALPILTFTDRLILDVGDLTLHLMYFGGMHTDDHIVIHVPEEGLLLTGDTLTDIWIPVISEGESVDIQQMLEHWGELVDHGDSIRRIITGHWDLDLSIESFQEGYGYIRRLWKEVQTARSAGHDLASVCKRLSLREIAPALQDAIYESGGIDYHRRNIELIWSLQSGDSEGAGGQEEDYRYRGAGFRTTSR